MQTWISGWWRNAWWLLLWPLCLTAAPQEPQVFVVYVDKKPQLVRDIRNGTCWFERDGKLVSAPRGAKTALAPVKECLPFFVAVRDMEARSQTVSLSGDAGSGEVNPDFEFRAKLESGFRLERVFFVIELESDELGRGAFYDGIGTLEPLMPRTVSKRMPAISRLGAGKFQLHLFSNGGELLHSRQPVVFRERQLDRMVHARLKGEQDAAVRPFAGPPPEYPQALLKQRISGEVLVRFRVSRTGEVINPVVQSASVPELGESALAAARLWRFLPKMKGGRAVESEVVLPFKFQPPPPDAK